MTAKTPVPFRLVDVGDAVELDDSDIVDEHVDRPETGAAGFDRRHHIRLARHIRHRHFAIPALGHERRNRRASRLGGLPVTIDAEDLRALPGEQGGNGLPVAPSRGRPSRYR